MNTDFFKVYGAKERQDGIVALGPRRSVILVGYGKDSVDAETGYNWRKDYDHIPDVSEIKADIDALINRRTEADILTGFSWEGKPVYLSSENQFNFKAAYDLALQTGGASLPVRFKLGEDADGNPTYHTFGSLDEFTDFYRKAIAHIAECLDRGWTEKDGIDYTLFEIQNKG